MQFGGNLPISATLIQRFLFTLHRAFVLPLIRRRIHTPKQQLTYHRVFCLPCKRLSMYIYIYISNRTCPQLRTSNCSSPHPYHGPPPWAQEAFAHLEPDGKKHISSPPPHTDAMTTPVPIASWCCCSLPRHRATEEREFTSRLFHVKRTRTLGKVKRFRDIVFTNDRRVRSPATSLLNPLPSPPLPATPVPS